MVLLLVPFANIGAALQLPSLGWLRLVSGPSANHDPGANREGTAALPRDLDGIIASDRYFLSPRIARLREIRAKLRPEPAREPLQPPKHYEPPRVGAKGADHVEISDRPPDDPRQRSGGASAADSVVQGVPASSRARRGRNGCTPLTRTQASHYKSANARKLPFILRLSPIFLGFNFANVSAALRASVPRVAFIVIARA
jgi:hypothetical protein